MDSQPYAHLIWIVPLALMVLYIGSPRFLGTMGHGRVKRVLNAALEKNRYTVFHNLTLPSGGGTVTVDFLIVSRFGIWAIRSIHRNGLISGTDVQDRWVQKWAGRLNRFENPVHENVLRLEVLERMLDLPKSRFHSLVVFSGQRGFKSGIPGNVIAVDQLLRRVRGQSKELLSTEEADKALARLHQVALSPGTFSRARRWKILRLVLLIMLLWGSYTAFQQPADQFFDRMLQQARIYGLPVEADGSEESKRQIWEESLICAHSSDTGRCACYEPGGDKASLNDQRCRELANKGSVLER